MGNDIMEDKKETILFITGLTVLSVFGTLLLVGVFGESSRLHFSEFILKFLMVNVI